MFDTSATVFPSSYSKMSALVHMIGVRPSLTCLRRLRGLHTVCNAKTRSKAVHGATLLCGDATFLSLPKQSRLLSEIRHHSSLAEEVSDLSHTEEPSPRKRKRGKRRRRSGKTLKEKRTHGPNGRLIMTDEKRKENPSTAELDSQTVRNMIDRIKAKTTMKFHKDHLVENTSRGSLNYMTTTVKVPSFLAKSLELPQNSTMEDDGSVFLSSMGVAQSRKQADFLSCIDLFHQLQECGIDPKNPPAVRSQQESEAKQLFRAQVQEAQMLLELLGVSRLRLPTSPTSDGRGYTSTGTVYYRGRKVRATGKPARSKALAQGEATLAVADALSEHVGPDRMNQYHALIQASPAQHVAVLQVEPLPAQASAVLSEAIGSPQDCMERRQKHAKAKAKFEVQFASRMERSRQRVNERRADNEISEWFIQKERARLEKALADPKSKQGKMKAVRDALPIREIREELLQALRTEQVVVVSGGTGSGKSTQCPQYILEDAIANGRSARILVTQPRRIAAISVAQRVADERDELIGNSVGYTVRFNRRSPRESGGSIEFVTTGVMLRRMVNEPELDGVDTVMIDEVHERDIDTDFLLVLLRDLLNKRPELRVVLMSATLDAESFAAYFSRQRECGTSVPAMSVPAKPRHPVEVVHLEDLAGESTEGTKLSSTSLYQVPSDVQTLAKSLLTFHDQQLQRDLEEADAEETAAERLAARSLAEDEGEIVDESDSGSDDEEATAPTPMQLSRAETLKQALSTRSAASGRSITAYLPGRNQTAEKREMGEVTVSLICKMAQYVARSETSAGRKGSVLCFLPGWDEIRDAMTLLEESDPSVRSRMVLLPLHSSIPQEDQQRVFHPAADGKVKVILATNIAESSVTIDDVLAVVDSGLVRELNFDAESDMSMMETVPTSRASATQRLGRAGRVAPGKCYRLYSRGALHAMLERPKPEIQRTALEATCLQTCSMTNDGVATFLQRAMDPPEDESVAYAMDRLVALGAINVEPRTGEESLSPLGRCLSRLPLDPATGRMLIMGCVMQCLDPVLTLAACFSSRDVFYTPAGMRAQQRRARMEICDTSDLMASVRAYNKFQNLVETKGWRAAKVWASDNFVSTVAMNSLSSVRSQLLNELTRIGLIQDRDLEIRDRENRRMKTLRRDASVNMKADIESIYSAVWSVGLPGNLAARRKLGTFGTLRTRMENHAELHPSSVAFHRKPPSDRTSLAPWFVYRDMVHTSQAFVRDCSAVSPEQIVLFGGYSLSEVDSLKSGDKTADEQLGEADSEGKPLRVLDDWIILEGPSDYTINLLAAARLEIEEALQFKVMNPTKPLPPASQSVIDAVFQMYESLDPGGDMQLNDGKPDEAGDNFVGHMITSNSRFTRRDENIKSLLEEFFAR